MLNGFSSCVIRLFNKSKPCFMVGTCIRHFSSLIIVLLCGSSFLIKFPRLVFDPHWIWFCSSESPKRTIYRYLQCSSVQILNFVFVDPFSFLGNPVFFKFPCFLFNLFGR